VIADVADVAIVGGGPAGAITAMLLARAGHAVVLLERSPEWRWRACGVFTSPARSPRSDGWA
jgi:menaquinone-9 beta-reductase